MTSPKTKQMLLCRLRSVQTRPSRRSVQLMFSKRDVCI